MGITLTDYLLFGAAKIGDIDDLSVQIFRRKVLQWGAIATAVDVVVRGVPPIVLPEAVADGIHYIKAYGGTEQGLLPDTYQLYTSVEANGITYEYSSQNLTQIPCKRIADNVFGLYNYTTKIFISEV